jgi:8-oxo-dGTP diphosphatase
MIKRKVATIIFYDSNRLLIQDRRERSKWGEDYGFFGGGIEEGETVEVALKREIKEELELDPKSYTLFLQDTIHIPEIDGEVERNIFLAPMPNLKKLKVHEGKIKLIEIKNIPPLKMVTGDLEILYKIRDSLLKS